MSTYFTCHRVPVSPQPNVPMSTCPHVPVPSCYGQVSPCPHGHMSQCPHVMDKCPHGMATCSRVPMSPYYHVPMAKCHSVLTLWTSVPMVNNSCITALVMAKIAPWRKIVAQDWDQQILLLTHVRQARTHLLVSPSQHITGAAAAVELESGTMCQFPQQEKSCPRHHFGKLSTGGVVWCSSAAFLQKSHFLSMPSSLSPRDEFEST